MEEFEKLRLLLFYFSYSLKKSRFGEFDRIQIVRNRSCKKMTLLTLQCVLYRLKSVCKRIDRYTESSIVLQSYNQLEYDVRGFSNLKKISFKITEET